jgi:hypothetical protein
MLKIGVDRHKRYSNNTFHQITKGKIYERKNKTNPYL